MAFLPAAAGLGVEIAEVEPGYLVEIVALEVEVVDLDFVAPLRLPGLALVGVVALAQPFELAVDPVFAVDSFDPVDLDFLLALEPVAA